MKNHRWLSVAEYLMLFGSGVGAVATAISQQVFYTATPLSILLVLNLLNHRRIEQSAQQRTETAVTHLDQKFSSTLNTLQQQIQTLPSPLHLANLRKDLQIRNQRAFDEITQTIQQSQQNATQPEWRLLPQEMVELREQYAALAESVAGVKESLSRLGKVNKTERVEGEIEQLKSELSQVRTNLQTLDSDQRLNNYRGLQDEIHRLNRRMNKLPAPFDASALRQDVESLIRAMGEMVSRRDLSRLEARVEQLTQQSDEVEQAIAPVKTVTTILRKQVDTVATRLNVFEEIFNPSTSLKSGVVEALTATVNTLEQRVERLPNSSDMANLRSELQGLVSSHMAPLQHQLDTVRQHAQDLDQQQRSLREWVQRLPQLLDASALQTEVKHLATRVEWAENSLTDLQAQVETPPTHMVFEVQQAESRKQEADQTVHSAYAPHSTAFQGSRTMLEQALANAQARLIVVYPFPTPALFDAEMMQRFQAFLERNGCLDVGWGHLGAAESQPMSRSIDRRRLVSPTENSFLFNMLNQLTDLKKQYPEQFRFKVLGTDEYFLVCDRAYALLGTQSVTTTSTSFPEVTAGLRITDADTIHTLVKRFDQPQLREDDQMSYFNRAATRYDLGDRQGAIADYTEVLFINPQHDAACNNRALVRYDLGDKKGAIADFDQALQHNSNNFIAYCNRGYVRSELGDKLGAIEDYTYALQLNPDYAIAYFYRGLARTRMQNKLGAIQDYTEVIRLNGQNASAYFYRGLAGAKIGQRTEAIRDLQQAAQLFATHGDATNYQQALSAIKKLHKTMVIGDAKPLVSSES